MAAKRSFVLAVAFLVLGACDDGGTPGTSRGTIEFDPDAFVWNDIVGQLCVKMISCGQQGQQSVTPATCQQMLQGSLLMQYLTPLLARIMDPYPFLECFSEMPCSAFAASSSPDDETGTTRAAADTSEQGPPCVADLRDSGAMGIRAQCVGDQLHVCNIYNVCQDTPCSRWCELLGLQGDRCSADGDASTCACGSTEN